MNKSSSWLWLEYGFLFVLRGIFVLLVGCIAFEFLAMHLESPIISERATETMVFPTGEILRNDSYRFQQRMFRQERMDFRHNQLSFQETISSPAEQIAEVKTPTFVRSGKPGPMMPGNPPLPVKSAKLLRSDAFPLAIAFNDYLFIRHPSPSNPHWTEFDIAKEPTAKTFLEPSPSSMFDQGHKPSYEFDHLDLPNGILVTRNVFPDSLLPRYLVYTTDAFRPDHVKGVWPVNDIFWHFDLAQTRQLNGLVPPPDPSLSLKILYKTPPSQTITPQYLAALKDNVDQSVPLSSTQWHSIDYSSGRPGADAQKSRLQVLFGFKDAEPGVYTIYWRGLDDYTPPNLASKVGEWRIITNPPGWPGGAIYYKIEASNE